jgi:hypothetical protein
MVNFQNPYGSRPLPMQPMNPRSVPAGVPSTQVLKPHHGLWSGSNELGYTIPSPNLNSASGWMASVIKMSEWGEPCSRVLTLKQLSQSSINTGGATHSSQSPGLYAEIVAGCGGASYTIICDWRDGVRIPFTGNTLYVNVVLERAQYNNQSPISDLSAFIGEGAGPTLPVTLTRRFYTAGPVDTIAPGAKKLMDAPSFGHSITVITKDGVYSPSVFLEFLYVDLPVASVLGRVSLADLMASGNNFVIPAGAQWVQIYNQSPDDVAATAIFTLGL